MKICVHQFEAWFHVGSIFLADYLVRRVKGSYWQQNLVF